MNSGGAAPVPVGGNQPMQPGVNLRGLRNIMACPCNPDTTCSLAFKV